MYRFLFILFFLFATFRFVEAQTSFDYSDEVIGVQNSDWFHYYGFGQSSQKGYIHNGIDSMYIFFDYPKKAPKGISPKYGSDIGFRIYYTGQFVNNQLEGEGTMELRNWPKYGVGNRIWIYKGQFKNGLANGFGELSVTIRARFGIMPCVFRGLFVDGKPLEGILATHYHQQYKDQPTLYYSGQVKFQKMHLQMEGWGALLRSNRDHDDIEQTSSLGLKGGFYAGQFYNGSMTGFGIGNYAYEPLQLGYLTTMLVGADAILKEYDPLPIKTGFLVNEPYQFGSFSNHSLHSFLPDVEKASYAEIKMGDGIVYKGMVYQNLPYGLGYVEYSDNLKDISFWKRGEKIAWKDLVDNLLPQKGMIEPKRIMSATRRCEQLWDKKYKYNYYECTKGIYPMNYFGAINENGFPIGWGWKISTVENNYITGEIRPIIGKFNGADPTADTSGLLTSDSLFQYGWQYNNEDKQNPYLGYPESFYFDLSTGWFQTLKPTGMYTRTFSNVGISDTYLRIKAHELFVASEKKRLAEKLSRKTISLSEVYYKTSNPSESYLVTNSGQRVTGIIIPRENLTEGDYVYIDKQLYHVHMGYQNIFLGESPNDGFLSTTNIPSNVLTFRGYYISLKHEEAFCSGCSHRNYSDAPITYTGSVQSGRYETNVYQNNSGTYTIASNPIYNSFSITVSPSAPPICKVCKGSRKKVKSPLKVVEW